MRESAVNSHLGRHFRKSVRSFRRLTIMKRSLIVDAVIETPRLVCVSTRGILVANN